MIEKDKTEIIYQWVNKLQPTEHGQHICDVPGFPCVDELPQHGYNHLLAAHGNEIFDKQIEIKITEFSYHAEDSCGVVIPGDVHKKVFGPSF